MDNEDVGTLKSILIRAFPQETDLLGEQVLEQIIAQRDSRSAPVKLPGGHDFDLSAVIEILKNASELAVALITIYRALKTKGKQPTSGELLAATASGEEKILTNDDKSKIAEAVLKLGA